MDAEFLEWSNEGAVPGGKPWNFASGAFHVSRVIGAFEDERSAGLESEGVGDDSATEGDRCVEEGESIEKREKHVDEIHAEHEELVEEEDREDVVGLIEKGGRVGGREVEEEKLAAELVELVEIEEKPSGKE